MTTTQSYIIGSIAILGAGESGVGAAILAKKVGYSPVFVSDAGTIADKYRKKLDAAGIAYESGGHTAEKILSFDEVMKSPGIPEDNAMVRQIRAKNIPVISEIELAYRHKGNSKIVGITGSNGKSTTTTLLYHMCEVGGLSAALVGNIGYSIAAQIAEDPKEWYIAEISSFQLDDIQTFRPEIAILLNITPDHLDRYDHKFENYVDAKFKIAENQLPTDYFIYCADDPVIVEKLKTFSIKSTLLPFTMKQEMNKDGAYIKDNQMMIKVQEERVSMNIYDFAVKGKHNQYNTMAAGIAGQVLRIRKEKIREAVQTFTSLEHRMEHVASVRGVEFINDSKATNLNSVWYALESMTKPTVLILGGIDKGNDYSLLVDDVKAKVKAIVCLGKDNSKIHAAFDSIVPHIVDTDNMIDAVKQSFSFSTSGDAVLLSPACSSFDLFTSYVDRGIQFREAVKAL